MSWVERQFGQYGILLIMPLLYLAFYWWQLCIFPPFFASRIDPEYVYLINGLNCGIFKFPRIGHMDHPGTPFQVFTGVCIRFVHVFFGKGELVSDVFGRPELYMRGSSHILMLLISLTIWKIGNVAYLHISKYGALLLQAALVFSAWLLLMQVRYTPDRFNIWLLLILVCFLVNYIFSPNVGDRKYAILFGLVSGLSVAVKVNVLPILIIPFFTLRSKHLLFVGSCILGFLVGVLPIIEHFNVFTEFIEKLTSHDGIYGSGNERFIDPTSFVHNLKNIIRGNVVFSLVILAAAVTWIWKMLQLKKLTLDKHSGYLLGFVLASLGLITLVSKHFKMYYLAPVLIFTALTLWVLFHQWNEIRGGHRKMTKPFLVVVCVSACMLTFIAVRQDMVNHRAKDKDSEALISFVDKERNAEPNYFILQPDWLYGPSAEYGLIFGISYVRHRFEYGPQVYDRYPDVLTYEGPDNPFAKMRLEPFNEQSFVDSPKRILTLNSENRPGHNVVERLQKIIADRAVSMDVDTIPFDDQIYLLSIHLLKSSR